MYLTGGGFVVAQMKLSIEKPSPICFKRGGGQLDGCTINLVHKLICTRSTRGNDSIFDKLKSYNHLYIIMLPKIIKFIKFLDLLFTIH